MLCRPSVLIVGNNDELMELIFDQLVKAFAGSCVLEFTSALSIACKSLAEVGFDAILFDLSVANHGRNAAVAAIRSVAPETPLFLMLDKNSMVDNNRGSREKEPYGLGADGYLLKHQLKDGIWIGRLHQKMSILGKFNVLSNLN